MAYIQPLPTESEIVYSYPGEPVELQPMEGYHPGHADMNIQSPGHYPDTKAREACILGFVINCFCGLFGLIGLACTDRPKDYFRGWCISFSVCAAVFCCTSLVLLVVTLIFFGSITAIFANLMGDSNNYDY
jgi:hypothetical protein